MDEGLGRVFDLPTEDSLLDDSKQALAELEVHLEVNEILGSLRRAALIYLSVGFQRLVTGIIARLQSDATYHGRRHPGRPRTIAGASQVMRRIGCDDLAERIQRDDDLRLLDQARRLTLRRACVVDARFINAMRRLTPPTKYVAGETFSPSAEDVTRVADSVIRLVVDLCELVGRRLAR